MKLATKHLSRKTPVLPWALTGLAMGMMVGTATYAKPITGPIVTQSVDPHARETRAQRDARMKWWREARFGMFIHWGLYAVPAGEWKAKDVAGRAINTQGYGEWIMHNAQIPVADYAALAPQFNPTRFNAEQWVSYAKAAGMKYIVVTAKHHDGFALYPTQVSPFNIKDATPFKRDPLAELAAACRKQGIKFGIYYSQNLDWSHPGGGSSGARWDPAQNGDFDTYVKNIAAPQVSELLTRYKPAVLWWDIPGNFSADEVRGLTAAFPRVPDLITNDRLGGGVIGDTQTPEQYIPATGFPNRDWEVCMTINDTWGYKANDANFKSSESLLRNLIDIASKGGNYLLNVGPDASGTIPGAEVQRLADIGAWMKKNGESIYATTASPYRRLPFDGRATVKGNTLYLNVFTWPAEGLLLPGLRARVVSAKAVATGQKLSVLKAGDGTLRISKPSQISSISTTIALKLSSPPVVIEPEIIVIPQADGSYKLQAADAVLKGTTIQIEESGNGANIGYWTDARDSVQWKIKVPPFQKRLYQAEIEYSCEPGSAGSTFRLYVDEMPSEVTGTVAQTAGWRDYQVLKLNGTLSLAPGTHTIQVKPLTKPEFAVMNLRHILLQPR